MAQLLEYLKMAIDNLRSNKGRSLLTMLGIIIGISSVIMIIAIGNGAQSQITNELNSIAGGQAYIYLNDSKAQEADYITQEDVDAAKEKVPLIKGISPYLSFSGTALGSKGDFNTSVQCGTSDLEYFLTNEKISKGRFFSEDEFLSARNVCVISETDAIKLFGTPDVIGMNIELTIWNVTQELQIVGVTKTESSGMLSSFMGTSDTISLYAPYSVLESAYGVHFGDFSYIYAITEKPSDAADMVNAIIKVLEARHNNRGEEIYLLQNAADQIGSITSVLSIITIFIIFVAAISLVVGGIGVMNIMLVSVTERTREIGIRKALGARTNSIMMQFLSESAIITLCGGIIGIMIGVLGAYAICSLPMLGFEPKIQFSTIAIATLFSSGVGIFFGIYPAKKAAKLSPIEALRRN
ncbi:ABC transporter permease [Lachnotalea glycerini]|uniref:Macrolide ABC transporter permease n=1 Tax=Lachnotalea glycerini TaxID=1763509 RepID=A0A371JHL7_9FIRM|nr:ABC transporter permease [Lachnotalea glycerini]RDY32235.1 macrolide ABC transporter permease [Lachnotalea glycerini]